MSSGLKAVLDALSPGRGAPRWPAGTAAAQEQAQRGPATLSGTAAQTFAALADLLAHQPEPARRSDEVTQFVQALVELLWHWPRQEAPAQFIAEPTAEQGRAAAAAARLLQLILTGSFRLIDPVAWRGWFVLSESFSPEVQVGALLGFLDRTYVQGPPDRSGEPEVFRAPHNPVLESVGEHQGGSLLPVFGLLAGRLDLGRWPQPAFDRLLEDVLDALPRQAALAVARSAERRAFLAALAAQPAFAAPPRAAELREVLAQATALRPTLPPLPAPSPVNADLSGEFAFRVAVLDSLMYTERALPPFDVYAFARTYAGREINLEQERYDLLPEVRDALMGLPITAELRGRVRHLSLDLGLSGSELPTRIIPEWSGEDDTFTVLHATAQDFLPFVNLETVAETEQLDEATVQALERRGVTLL